VGTPVVADAAVEAEVVGRDRGDKVIAFKYRPKARRRVKRGHRQELTLLRIADIRFGGKSAAKDQDKAREQQKSQRERLPEAAAPQPAEDAARAGKLAAGAEPAEAPKRTRAKAGTGAAAAEKPAAKGKAEAKSEAAEAEAPAAEAETPAAEAPK